jgi:hypothetical protein
MQRRTLLGTLLGLPALLLSRWSMTSRAADPPSSAGEAIRIGSPDAVIGFIKADAARAGRSTALEKAQMLKIIATPKDGAYARSGLLARGEAENAALILLKSAERNATEMSAIVGALGGTAWVQQQMPAVVSPELRRVASLAASTR